MSRICALNVDDVVGASAGVLRDRSSRGYGPSEGLDEIVPASRNLLEAWAREVNCERRHGKDGVVQGCRVSRWVEADNYAEVEHDGDCLEGLVATVRRCHGDSHLIGLRQAIGLAVHSQHSVVQGHKGG